MQAETGVLLTDVVGEAARPVSGDIDDYNPLMDLLPNGKRVKCRQHFQQVFREGEFHYENERDSQK